jgi:hypothetical protein
VEDLKVSGEDREKIFWRNAAKLLMLDPPLVAQEGFGLPRVA